jgi:hypothetical protein
MSQNLPEPGLEDCVTLRRRQKMLRRKRRRRRRRRRGAEPKGKTVSSSYLN